MNAKRNDDIPGAVSVGSDELLAVGREGHLLNLALLDQVEEVSVADRGRHAGLAVLQLLNLSDTGKILLQNWSQTTL